VKVTVWLTVYPWTVEGERMTYFASNTPPTTPGADAKVYEVAVHVPDPFPKLNAMALSPTPTPAEPVETKENA
jgi:hypothetical protein